MNKNNKWLRLEALFSAAVIGSLSLVGIQPANAIFLDDPETVTQQDLGLAFAFFTLGGSPTATQLIDRANLLLPGTDLDIPVGSVLTPPEPALENFKAFADGGTELTQQDLGVFFAAFTLLQGQPDPGSVELTSEALCTRANLLLPGTDLDIPPADFDKCVDPRTLGATSSSLELKLEGIPAGGGAPRNFVLPGDTLRATIIASKSNGIQAGSILLSLFANATLVFPGSAPVRVPLILQIPDPSDPDASPLPVSNEQASCPVGKTTPCEITRDQEIPAVDALNILGGQFENGRVRVVVDGAGFGIRKTASATIDVLTEAP